MLKKVFFIIGVYFYCINSFSQYQLNNNPLRLNPSFAGAKSEGRITGSYLNSPSEQGFDKTINYGHISFDKFIKGMRSGVGVYYSSMNMNYKEEIGYTKYHFQSFGLCIAPKFLHFTYKAFPKLTISPSLGFDYHNYKKSFGCSDVDSTKRNSIYSIRFGLLANSDRYFFGLTFRDLFFENHNTLYTSLHGGFVFQKNTSSSFSFSPMFNVILINPIKSPIENVRSKAYYFVEAVNLNFRYNKIIFGTGLPIGMIGYQNDNLRISLSYNLKLNKSDSPYDWYTPRTNWQISSSFVFKGKS